MDVQELVKLAARTHEACGWSGTGMFELEPDTVEAGSLDMHIDIHQSKLSGKELLESLTEIKENIYTIWGNKQKGIEFWESDTSESGFIVSICLDKGTPEK